MIKIRKQKLTNYSYIHDWNNRLQKKLGSCEFCGLEKKTEWALMHGKEHKRGLDNYLELCKKCHISYDKTDEWDKKRLESLKKTYSHRNPIKNKECEYCEESFKPARKERRFCSNSCSNKGGRWLELNKE
jgi:hypothetical protein